METEPVLSLAVNETVPCELDAAFVVNDVEYPLGTTTLTLSKAPRFWLTEWLDAVPQVSWAPMLTARTRKKKTEGTIILYIFCVFVLITHLAAKTEN